MRDHCMGDSPKYWCVCRLLADMSDKYVQVLLEDSNAVA